MSAGPGRLCHRDELECIKQAKWMSIPLCDGMVDGIATVSVGPCANLFCDFHCAIAYSSARSMFVWPTERMVWSDRHIHMLWFIFGWIFCILGVDIWIMQTSLNNRRGACVFIRSASRPDWPVFTHLYKLKHSDQIDTHSILLMYQQRHEPKFPTMLEIIANMPTENVVGKIECVYRLRPGDWIGISPHFSTIDWQCKIIAWSRRKYSIWIWFYDQ